MRIYLTNPDLETVAGKQLLELAIRIAADGKLELAGIKELWSWLRKNRGNDRVAAVGYLHGIMSRITANGVIDRDELTELHLAIERVIPAAHRTPIIDARKKREAVRRQRLQEHRRIEQEKVKEEGKRLREEEYARKMRFRHAYAKVAGVTFPNDDGSERQEIIGRCWVGEGLILRRDTENRFSSDATQVLRASCEQLGHVPEYLAERICHELEAGYKVAGIITDLTGGSWDRPTRGVNFIVFFLAADVIDEEFQQYAKSVVAFDAAKPRASAEVDLAFSAPAYRPAKPWWKFW